MFSRVLTAVVFTFALVDAHGPINSYLRPPAPKVLCGPDTVLISLDCWSCVCPKPNKPARCYPKKCDSHDKQGSCPAAQLKMDDHALCQLESVAQCKSDFDCPGADLCCFSYCKGAVCAGPQADPRGPSAPRNYMTGGPFQPGVGGPLGQGPPGLGGPQARLPIFGGGRQGHPGFGPGGRK